MDARHDNTAHAQALSRRDLLKAGLAAGITVSAWPFSSTPTLWGGELESPKRGGILRVRGFDPPHFDPHIATANFTQSTLSFVYSKLVRHKVGGDVHPGRFIVEPDVAERWEELDDTTYIFYLRKGVKWHNKSPVNGRELVADDIKFTYDRDDHGHLATVREELFTQPELRLRQSRRRAMAGSMSHPLHALLPSGREGMGGGREGRDHAAIRAQALAPGRAHATVGDSDRVLPDTPDPGRRGGVDV